MDKKKLNSRDYALIAQCLIKDIDFTRLEFQSLNPASDDVVSIENWNNVTLLYGVISQFIDDEPLPF